MNLHPDWLVPQWPLPAGVRAVCATREGGVSQGLFASMNLGDHVGDTPADVAANRVRLAAGLGARPVFMKQVHGVQIARLAPDTPDGVIADGAVTTRPGLACTVMVADCLPVLLAHERLPVVAALHAGWRGLAGSMNLADAGQGPQGILEAGWQQCVEASGVDDRTLAPGMLAWLGPCIGPQVFEVGPEVREAFVGAMPEAQDCFQPGEGGRFLANLPGLARQRLKRLGITQVFGNDGSSPWCTVSNSRFFSHRRVSGRNGASPGDTGGRLAACIWLA